MDTQFSERMESSFEEFDWSYLDFLNFDPADFVIDDDSSQGLNNIRHKVSIKTLFIASSFLSLPFFSLPDAGSDSKATGKVVKATVSKTIAKVAKKKKGPDTVKGKSPFRKGMTIEQTFAEGGATPNMSRRTPTSRLIVFPTFDKCDSLIYFPSTLCRHLNSADIVSVSKLIVSHFDKNCKVRINVVNEVSATIKSFIKILNIYNCVEPDRILCCHSTKVIDNEIHAVAYMKTTDSQLLYGFMEYSLRDPILKVIYPVNRTDRFSFMLDDCSMTDKMKEELMAHADTTDDLLMYMRVDLVMTIDEVTKKVVNMSIKHELTSVHPVSLVDVKDSDLTCDDSM